VTRYETRPVAWIVAPVGDPTFSEMATTIRIDDEAGGEFVVVDQSGHSAELGKVQIGPDEWPAIRAAIDKAMKQCRSVEQMDELSRGRNAEPE
jgi:hypothetical protein